MKLNSLNHVPAIMLFLLCMSAASFGQTDTDKPFEVHLNNQLIKENKIKSLTVYADFNENGIDTHGGFGGKVAEVEFDANGNQIYKITSSNGGNLPFIEYGRGTKISIDSFDLKNRKLSTYVEDRQYSMQTLTEYDADGNVAGETTIIENDTLVKMGFVWSDGKMVQARVLHIDNSNKNTVNDFNPDGKIRKHISGNLRQEYDYAQTGENAIKTVNTYIDNSLVSAETYSTNTSTGQITHYTRKNHLGELELEMKLQFDESGNATSYYLNDRTEKYQDEFLPPYTIVIQNVYNSQNLLVKRLYFETVPDAGTNILTRIERYFYDSGPLHYKLQKGFLMRGEMMEEEYNDR